MGLSSGNVEKPHHCFSGVSADVTFPPSGCVIHTCLPYPVHTKADTRLDNPAYSDTTARSDPAGALTRVWTVECWMKESFYKFHQNYTSRERHASSRLTSWYHKHYSHLVWPVLLYPYNPQPTSINTFLWAACSEECSPELIGEVRHKGGCDVTELVCSI